MLCLCRDECLLFSQWPFSSLANVMTDTHTLLTFPTGFPVGTMAAFMWSMLVSALFDFIGYFMTTILATSHAGRVGYSTFFESVNLTLDC